MKIQEGRARHGQSVSVCGELFVLMMLFEISKFSRDDPDACEPTAAVLSEIVLAYTPVALPYQPPPLPLVHGAISDDDVFV